MLQLKNSSFVIDNKYIIVPTGQYYNTYTVHVVHVYNIDTMSVCSVKKLSIIYISFTREKFKRQ